MTTNRGSAGTGALVAASLLLGISAFAASPARAQVCEEGEQGAYGIFVALADTLSEIADQVGSEPSQGECEAICRISQSLCVRETRLAHGLLTATIKGLTRASKSLCRSAADRASCTIDAKMARVTAMEAARMARSLMVAACLDLDLADACEDACNDAPPFGDIPACCEELFYGASCVAMLGAPSIPPPVLPPAPPPPSGGAGGVSVTVQPANRPVPGAELTISALQTQPLVEIAPPTTAVGGGIEILNVTSTAGVRVSWSWDRFSFDTLDFYPADPEE